MHSLMLRQNLRTDRSKLLLLLQSCGGAKQGESMHCHILKMGLVPDKFLQTGLLDFYSKSGSLDAAERVFEEMPDRDIISHNAMIAALASRGRVGDAKRLFEAMPEKNSSTWNSMISCFCKQDDLESARAVFDMNPVKDIVSYNTMIDGYCKQGRMEVARELFDRMGSARNSITWNTLISGYSHQKDFNAAIGMFRKMQAVNARPTEVTMVSLLSACAHLGALDTGRWIHAYIKNHRLNVDAILGNALIDMYNKCGSVGLALDVFHQLPEKNIYCWNSVIVGLGMHGYGREAIMAFNELVKGGHYKPDNITFVGLLSACSHSGLVDKGRRYFKEMQGIYGVEPTIEHYGCMVDLLGRAGLLKEALSLIETMCIRPNCVVWGSLLRASRNHMDTDLSERLTQLLLELDPSDGGNYVFLSNVYSTSNRWNDVDSCRRTMTERGVRKTPGCSSIELDNIVHEFVAGDSSHPQFGKIYASLIDMDKELGKLGYRPNINYALHDIEEEDKEDAKLGSFN